MVWLLAWPLYWFAPEQWTETLGFLNSPQFKTCGFTWQHSGQTYGGGKHGKNCKCCPVSLLIGRSQRMSKVKCPMLLCCQQLSIIVINVRIVKNYKSWVPKKIYKSWVPKKVSQKSVGSIKELVGTERGDKMVIGAKGHTSQASFRNKGSGRREMTKILRHFFCLVAISKRLATLVTNMWTAETFLLSVAFTRSGNSVTWRAKVWSVNFQADSRCLPSQVEFLTRC